MLIKIFNRIDLASYLRQSTSALELEIKSEEKNYLLNADESTYINYLVDKHTINPLIFEWDNVYGTEQEKPIPADKFPSDFMMRDYYGKSFSKLVITYHLPFSGDPDLLEMMPASRLLWTIEVELDKNKKEICFDIINWYDDPEKIKTNSSSIINNIKQQSINCRSQIEQHNAQLQNKISTLVSQRKEELLKQSHLVKNLGIPIRRATDVKETFSIPIKKKQITISKPESSNLAYIAYSTPSRSQIPVMSITDSI